MANYTNLLKYMSNKYTTMGNDGIIEYIFKILNIKEGTFVEFGAWDGLFKCNCRKLFEEGWTGIFIESDKKKYNKLYKNYKNNKQIQCINKKVKLQGSNLFDTIVDPYLNGQNIDFCVIDIDGLDLDVFETFEKYLPTVVCIEGGFVLSPSVKRIPSKIAKNGIQQSLGVFIEVFEKKGYKILCSGLDCFFIKKEFYSLFNVETNLLKLYCNGLKVFKEKIPTIEKKCRKSGIIKNDIVEYILKKCPFDFKNKKRLHSFSWTRKMWSKKNTDKIFMLIDNIIERNKYGK